ncbi:MAG: malate synthase G [Gammaproteobacteria bacterium]|nr:MAG: malate synthase G [Gammaproteobacteria bacterium]
MTERVQTAGLQIARVLHDLVNNEIIPGTGIKPESFWSELARCVSELGPKNHALIEERESLQAQIDNWHRQHAGVHDPDSYKAFLQEIGYLLPPGEDFTVTTDNTDPEINEIAGPQLVVPVMNARYALNATNARWGSLYDSLYGTDVIPQDDGAELGKEFNPRRSVRAIEYAMAFLDEMAPLRQTSHAEVTAYHINNGQLVVTLPDGSQSSLEKSNNFAGYRGSNDQPTVILLHKHGLHVELHIDPDHYLGKFHPAGISDVQMEAAITTIQDCEDSVATVDAEDKALVYRNWLGLMKGGLSETFTKGDRKITRTLNADREYITPDGGSLTLPGRSLLLIRNVGHLMYTDAILDENDNEIPEGIMDGMITSLAALHDLNGNNRFRNSRAGSIYIVKPKMHGPAEVEFANELFNFIEDALGMERFTLKMGIMDEERRTSLNLKECIRATRERIVFINTGFLDRTGDEIHTSMEAGAMVRKAAMKDSSWIKAYENSNVDIGLACGLQGKAQIGKGMWAMPDEMHQMMENKITHPLAGANTAWVPSPTAAVLHAMHYHKVDVKAVQEEMKSRPPAKLDDMLIIPLLGDTALSDDDIQKELDNNAQGILGYVVRWIDQGVGCSKVPDIRDIGLMEDRATLRISSQHIANWLHHGICNEQQVHETLERMAVAVDQQNAGDPNYHSMAPYYENSIAFQAACDLIFKGREQPSGYTEPLLYQRRREAKAMARR